MKTNDIIIILFMLILFGTCTSDFDDINTDPNAVTVEDASARYFLTNVQFNLYAPNRFPYWRAHLIHADRYSGQACFGHHGSWWSDELGYSYNPGYTDASWGWLSGYFGGLDNFMSLTEPGGDFENELMFAVAKIIKGLYFQMYTDTFGEIPYSEVGDPDILQPKFNTQKEIYKGVIAELNEAIAAIGDNERTGTGIEDLAENDIYFGGDLQKWKKLANTLKLRMALRAHGAEGDDFSSQAINEALSAPLLESEDDNCLMEKDNIISQWSSAAYGDVWHNFGLGSNWTVGKPLIDYLSRYNDPRLEKYAKPIEGGTITLNRPNEATNKEGYDLWPKRVEFILSNLEDSDVEFTRDVERDTLITITISEDTYYAGQPVRLNGFISSFARFEFYSQPSDWVIQKKNEGKPIFPEIVMTTAEAYFLRAEAAVKGMNNENAQEMFENGIRHAMKIWEVGDGDIDTYLAEAELAKLNGSEEDNLRKIAIQRWIAAFTDGFEAWAIVRDTGYPEELANGVTDEEIFGLGDINGLYPQRMQYGNDAKDKNGANLQEAISRQGPDRQDVKLWWAK